MTMDTTDPAVAAPDETAEDGHEPAPGGDVVDRILADVRAELARRRAEGSLPELGAAELERQFSAVVEAADAGLVEEPPVDVGPLTESTELATWRPSYQGMRGKVLQPIAHQYSRLVGMVVRRQMEPFALETTRVAGQLADREQRWSRFLVRAHLERIRALERRVAELERRLDARDAEESGGAEPN